MLIFSCIFVDLNHPTVSIRLFLFSPENSWLVTHIDSISNISLGEEVVRHLILDKIISFGFGWLLCVVTLKTSLASLAWLLTD